MSQLTVPQEREYTYRDIEKLDAKGLRYELVQGELVPMSPTSRAHGSLTQRFAFYVIQFIEDNDLNGEYYAAETGFLVARKPDTVLAPDFAYVKQERLLPLSPRGYSLTSPDLVLETKSPSDSLADLTEKMRKWMAFGVPLGWMLDPETLILTVFRPGREPIILGPDGVINGADVLPGFELPLTRLFRKPKP